MSGEALTDLHGDPITPEGCAVPECGVPRRSHVQLYVPKGGWHTYEQPTPQLIAQRARLLRRLKDAKIVEDGEQAQAAAEAQAFARWLHDDEPYGKVLR